MSFIEALLLSLALCVDSFVVSAASAVHSKFSRLTGLKMAAVFALCQAACPLAGALIGDTFRSVVEAYDHWIAFALLAAIGGKMIVDGIRNTDENPQKPIGLHSVGLMFMLGMATSIDSLAVGIGLGLNMAFAQILKVVALIGITTFLVAWLGAHLGRRNIPIPQRTSTIVAGVVLIGLGIKILLEHLGAI